MADPENNPPSSPPASAPDADPDSEPVPKIGRGRHRRRWSYYFPPQQVISLFALIIGLIAVMALRDSCARGAGNFIKAFDAPPDGGPAGVVPRP